MQAQALQRISYKRLIFYAVTVAAIVAVYLRFSELKLLQDFFSKSNYIYLSIIIAIQAFSFLFQAVNYRVVLGMKGLDIKIGELFPVSFVVQFISQAIPTAGISGQAFLIYYLRKYKITLAEGVGRAILELTTLYLVAGMYFILTIFLLIRNGIFGREPKLIYFVYGFVVFGLACILVLYLSQKNNRESRIHRLFDLIIMPLRNSKLASLPGIKSLVNNGEHWAMIKGQFQETLDIQILRKQKWQFFQACFWQVMLLFTHVATLLSISYAIGHPLTLTASLAAFTFAKFISMISVIPGAPGIFEGIMILVLISFGVDKSVAFAVTLLTRAFTFWLPMPIGWILYVKYMRQFEEVE